MTTITEPGLYPDISNEDYHRDPTAAGSLSVSGAKTLIKAPALYKWERDHPVFKDVFDFGSVAHAKALGDDTVQIEVIDAKDWTLKATREIRDEARAAGRVPILAKDALTVDRMVTALQSNRLAMSLLSRPGKSEQSGFWQDERSGVWRRVRFDRLPDSDGGRLFVVDYKTAVSSRPDDFAKAAMNFGYHQQDPWYTDAAQALGLADDVAFLFVVQEKTAPYLVTVIELDARAKAIGRYLNDKALDLFAECTKTDVWPGYTDEVAHIELPYYYTREFEAVA